MCHTTKHCSESGCPFAFTDESEQIQNYGCLPTPYDIMVMRLKHGKTWACHSNPKKPCLGALEHLRKEGLQHKMIDKQLVTDNEDWSIYVK